MFHVKHAGFHPTGRQGVYSGYQSWVNLAGRFRSPDLDGHVPAPAAVELFVAPNAELEHLSIIDWGSGIRHQLVVRAQVDREAKARSVVVTLGGDVVRVEPTMQIVGAGADARALGLFFAGCRAV